MSGIKLEKERKMRLLCWRVFSLSKSRRFNGSSLLHFYLFLVLSLVQSSMYVVCRRLVRPSRSRAPPSLSRGLVSQLFTLFVPFHLNGHLSCRYKEYFVSQTLQGGHDGTKTTQRFPRPRFSIKISQRTKSFVGSLSHPQLLERQSV